MNARLQRWILRLQPYLDMTIRHRPGTSHIQADALSRMASPGQGEQPPTPGVHVLLAFAISRTTTVSTLCDLWSQPQPLVTRPSPARPYVALVATGTSRLEEPDPNTLSATFGQGIDWIAAQRADNELSKIIMYLTHQDEFMTRTLPAEVDAEMNARARNTDARPNRSDRVMDLTDEQFKEFKRNQLLLRYENMYGRYYAVQDGILYRLERTRLQQGDPKAKAEYETVRHVVVPATDENGRPLRARILKECHEGITVGHAATTKTLSRLRQHAYWTSMAQDVINWVRNCASCQQVQPPPRHGNVPLIPVRIGRPFDKVAVDIVGPVPESEVGNRYILTLVDYATRWAEAYPLRNVTAELVTDLIVERFIPQFGLLGSLLSDRGAQFYTILLACVACLTCVTLLYTTAKSILQLRSKDLLK